MGGCRGVTRAALRMTREAPGQGGCSSYHPVDDWEVGQRKRIV